MILSDKYFIRIISIGVENLKNVGAGKIMIDRREYPSDGAYSSDIIGIYGQNGSGKTAVVDAMKLIKQLLTGAPLSPDAYELIGKRGPSRKLTLRTELYIEHPIIGAPMRLYYEAVISGDGAGSFYISTEKVSYKSLRNSDWSPKSALASFSADAKDVFLTPKGAMWEPLAKKGNYEEFIIAGLAKGYALRDRKSFVFTYLADSADKDIFSHSGPLSALRVIREYAALNLFVKNNADAGIIYTNTLIPVSASCRKEDGRILLGTIPVTLRPCVYPKQICDDIKRLLDVINPVLGKIIPSLRIDVKEEGEQVMDDGKAGVRCEFLAVRGGVSIPLKNESDGILRLVSVLGLLVDAYNNPSICVVIDEFDSGIFEYLLGELIKLLESNGKGQIIFTSHNLRALEVLPNQSVYVTTTNPQNRYVHMRNVRDSNNNRNTYYRLILLGDGGYEFYDAKSRYEIDLAFRRAAK